MQPADAVHAPAVRSASAVMLNSGAAAVVVRARARGTRRDAPEGAPGAGQMRFDQVEGKRVVAGRHRRVRREHGGAPDFLERVSKLRPVLDQLADALQHDERGVPFVQMPDRRVGRRAP